MERDRERVSSKVPSLALTRPPLHLVSGAMSDDGTSIRGARSIKEARGRPGETRRRSDAPSFGDDVMFSRLLSSMIVTSIKLHGLY